ncbi:YciI family protein [Nocardia sp. NPDC051030]|uniref:YciI family protein n=1 Tax=Nocardia sp. NPDC051030 TaxID=3155162 RepID=UPI0034188207
MKYMILIYGNTLNWGHPMFLRTPEALAASPEQRKEWERQFVELITEIDESGEMVGTEALADPVNTKTVRVRNGMPATTDGPYGESKEQLAGYFIVDCESLERVEEIASRFPDALFGAIEIRPVMDKCGLEP